MPTFLVLPPRELLEHALAAFLARTLPGVSFDADTFFRLLEGLPPGTIVVHREDLPDARAVAAGLSEAFGAEPGDLVREIGPPLTTGLVAVREWVVPAFVSATGPAR